ncbi:MAG: hypothetical protein ACW98A_14970 [Candidatus Hodarchaeales archaeon]|jgi:K+-sensing histidine kinase KdpD
MIYGSENVLENKEVIQETRHEEEHYITMLSHFLNNELQKIINYVDILFLKHKNNEIIEEREIKKINDVASHTSNIIGTVNKIFKVLQTSEIEDSYRSIINIRDIIYKILTENIFNKKIFCRVEIEGQNNIGNVIRGHFLEDIFREILLFLITYNKMNSKIRIIVRQLNAKIFISIRDSCSQPIPKESCIKISNKITKDWESDPRYLGLVLASTILLCHGGQMKIYPDQTSGNEFHLLFPSPSSNTDKRKCRE